MLIFVYSYQDDVYTAPVLYQLYRVPHRSTKVDLIDIYVI